ncbi:hypothetical protein [Kitasatospora sp. LaBMicrA B282]|uniref:hypothetical protein n=1 Tax=Kitasatospora sp. LaBMicrA B282 TaxID=3420949 RepID=UPI003D0988C6
MELLLFRAALAPSLVLLASLVARRSGPRRGGQLLGAPTSTGPFLALTWLGSGPGRAAAAAHGTVTGTLVVACFCLAYGRLAATRRPLRTLLAALGCAAAGNVWLTAALTVAVVGGGLLTWPATAAGALPPGRPRAWEIPVRMAFSAVTVLAALAAATALGSFVGGVLSALPVLLSVMGTSVHRTAGPRAAADLMRGALTSAAGTLGFLLVLCFAPVPLGPGIAFLLAGSALVLGDALLRCCVLREVGTARTA